MTALLELKQRIKNLYSQYEIYILPVLRFVLAMVYFIWINKNMGYMTQLNNIFIVLILALIRKGIVYYAMHTNYDVLGMADLSADYTKMHNTAVLSVTEERDGEAQGFGRVGDLSQEMTLREYAKLVKESLKLNDVKVYGDLDSKVKRAAVCTGSGKSMIKDAIKAGADVYVTGDIDHHTGIDTVAQGLALIDAGHYGTEYVFMDAMKREMAQEFPELKISCAEVKSPYTIL